MKTPFKILFLAVGCWLLAFAASAQVDVTKRGITPPHNIKNHDYTQIASKFGQMLGVKKFGTSAGDTLVGFLPVYYLGDSTLKVGAYTVVHSGNVTTYAPGTDLSYTASSRLLASSTGADATLPLFTSTEAGLVPLSGGGTSNFLRADGTWAAPVGSVTSVGLSMPTGFSVSGSPVTSSGTLAVSTTLTGVVQGNGSGLTASLGTANQLLRTNAGATAAEWFTPTYLTANQTITLSGDVTGSGSTAITTTIGTGAVTSAKILDGTIAAADLSAMGASSGQVMQWNGSAWVATTPSGGTPGGSTTQVQYNNAGAFAGDTDFTFDGTTVSLTPGLVETTILRVPFAKGGTYTSSGTGAIEVSLPSMSTLGTFNISFDVRINTRDEGAIFTINGYATEGGSRTWYKQSNCYYTGIAEFPAQSVRFGVEGGVLKVWIGELTKVWASVLSVSVENVVLTRQSGTTPTLTQLGTGWVLALESTAFGTINQTRTNPIQASILTKSDETGGVRRNVHYMPILAHGYLGSSPGAIEITLPNPSSLASSSVSFSLKGGINFSSLQNTRFFIFSANYNYSTRTFYLPKITWLNGEPTGYAVRVGDDGANGKIWIGELADSRTGLDVFLSDLETQNLSAGLMEDFKTGWSITLESTSFDNVDASLSANVAGAISFVGEEGRTYNTGFYWSNSTGLNIPGDATLTGILKGADGTASAPSYTFTNDLNTGFYRPTADVIGFTTGGTEEMRLTTTGLLIGTAGSNQGNLQLAGSTSGTVTVTTQAAAGTYTLTLPTGAGSSGQVLQTNGSGVTSWATVSASPGGSTTHVQYNNAGSFGGSANFTFNGTNVSLANPIYYATGSSAAPSISFTGDTNMGIYRAAADDLAIVAGGADIVRVNANGVGIGVVPSIYTLDITSTNAARIPGGTTAQRPTAAARLLRYNSDNETIEWNNGTTWYQAVTGTGSASRVAVWTGGLNLTNDAELGYNTTTNVLSVGGKIENAAGTAGAPTYTFSGDNTMGMYGSSGTLNWSTSGTLRMTINTDGTTKLTSTASATNSTINTLYYNKSTSAVDDDYLTLAYNLDDSGGNETTFGQIRIISENVTNGSEGGQFAFLAQKKGTLTQLATLDATSFSLNNLTPFKTGQFTATQASAISPQNGMLIYVTSTNATFTSVGHWARENGVWVKL